VDTSEDEPLTEQKENSISVAIVGKPNVGKSKLFNGITNEERAIVSPISGTTRDAIDTHYSYNDIDFTFIDTAGMRRRGKVEQGIEQFSVIRTIAGIERADLCMLLIGADKMVTAQDTHIAGYVKDSGRASVVVVNKWDLAADETTREKAIEEVRDRLSFLPAPSIVFTNARKLTSEDIDELLQNLIATYEQFRKEVPQYELSKCLAAALAHKMPSARRGVFPQFGRIKQINCAPPVFEVEVDHPEYIHFSYRRFLENRLRDEFGFAGSPLIVRFRNFAR
jgi:GTP-binding protein